MSLHEQAVAVAAQVLAEHSFIRDNEFDWRGSLATDSGGVPVSVHLPKQFPYCLPEISVNRKQLRTRLAHVEESGRLCLAVRNGIRLDFERPGQLVEEALVRALTILNGAADAELELLREFQAYWGSLDQSVASICRVDGTTREILLVQVDGGKRFGKLTHIFADDPRQFREWAGRVGVCSVLQKRALFVGCASPFQPPSWDEPAKCGRLLRQVLERADSRAILSKMLVPADTREMNMVLSLPLGEGDQRNLVACQIPLQPRKAMRQQPVPLACLIARGTSPHRYNLARLDPGYLLPRAGGVSALSSKTVAVVGCGSIGSALVTQLAAAGIGRLRLVDTELLEDANVHRHSCGVRFLGLAKVNALQLLLGEQFPHVVVEPHACTIEEMIEKKRDVLETSDLVVVALGDETTELWLNEYAPSGVPRMHVWVEAYGLGGHVLELGRTDTPGCYRCLFGRRDDGAFANRALLAADNQSFGRAITGCVGTFTPYGAADAIRAACEGQRAAIRSLMGDWGNRLTSWMTDSTEFARLGYALSARGREFRPGETKLVIEFAANSQCPKCRQ